MSSQSELRIVPFNRGFFAAWLCVFSVLISPAIGAQETQKIPVNSDEAIPVGPFLFSPAVQLSWQARDNIFFTPDDPVSDQVYLARARLLFEIPIYESYVQFSYTPQYRDYKEYELEDKWGHFVDVAGAFEFASGMRLNATYNYIVGNLETREVDPGGELVWGDRRFTKNFAALGGDYFFTQTDGIIFEGTWTDIDHEDPELFYDYTRLYGTAGWLHQISPILVMTVNYGYIAFDAKDSDIQSNSFRDSSSNELTLGLKGQLSPVVATELAVGYRRTSYDLQPGDPPVSDFSGVIANGFISWDLAHDSALRLDVLRSDYPSNYGPNAYYVATGGSLMYNLDRGSFFGQARGRLQNNDYELPDPSTGDVRSDDIFSLGLGLGYRFTDLFSLWGTYLYEDRDSTVYEASYETNIFTLGLVFGF
jgi:hypothetical protein